MGKFNFGNNSYSSQDPKLYKPWLIQRCKSGEFKSDMKSSEYLKLDYMGAAEFEFGALPEWQREMNRKLSQLVINVVEHGNQKLYFMCEERHVVEYSQILKDLIDGKIQTKMGVRLDARETRWTEPKKKGGRSNPIFNDPSMPYEYDCFWDITNGLVFARSVEILTNLKVTIPNSVRYMDEQRKKA